MKSEYVDGRDTINATASATTATINTHLPTHTTDLFSRFRQQKFETHPQNSLHHPHPQYPHPTSHNHHHFYLTKDPQTSEEADSSAAAATATTIPTTTNPPPKKPKISTPTTNEDGETIEVVRRPRGRPPGSKNKPKPPDLLNREPDPSMSPYILEIPCGVDIINSLTRLTRCRGMGLCVLSAYGSVANVTLRQPGGGNVSFHGRFEMLSLSALLLTVSVGNLSILGGGGGGIGNGSNVNGIFTISLAGAQGQIVGGKVAGPLVAADTVYVVAASFNNPTYHRLPVEGEADSGGGERLISSSPGVSGGGGGDGAGDIGVGGTVMYSCHLGSDVIWAPTARSPHQHPPPQY